MRLLIVAATLSLGCGSATSTPAAAADTVVTHADPGPEPNAAEKPKTQRLVVINSMGFTKDVNGVAPGFDIDGRVSDDKDPKGCQTADQTSPDGVKGIDNELAKLVPAFEAFGIGAAESLVQGAIRDGGLLLMLQIDGVDDPVNDPEVSVMVRVGMGKPLLGTDGLLLPGQTFGIHPETPDSKTTQASLKDGVLNAGPFDTQFPIVVFGVRYDLHVKTTHIRARLTWDGQLTDGILGGGVPLVDLKAIGVTAAKDDPKVLAAINGIFGSAGDLDPQPDGSCAQISATLAFTAVSAYLFADGSGSGVTPTK